MRLAGGICALLVGSALGCTDPATVGGVCRDRCLSLDAGVDAGRDAGPAGEDAGAADAGRTCRDGAYELTRMRLDLVIVLDDTASVGPWLPALYDGLTQFLHADTSKGLGVGLQRFDELCDPQDYTNLIVPIAPLPGNAQALDDALTLMLYVSTSTTPALDGALRSARAWATSHADARVAVVLLTDASPGACDGLVGDYDAEAQRLARVAYEGTPSIKTYVVGFGTMAGIDLIPRAGGTEPMPISVTPADGEVQAALDDVRRDAQPCAFRWPAGWTLAPSSSVVATAADGERRYPIVAGSAACDPSGGFYVEDPSAAFPLVACPSSCVEIAAAQRLALSSACAMP
jgi:hypothetical protein